MSRELDDFEDDYVSLRERLFVNPWLGEIDERVYAAFRMVFAFVAFVNLVCLW